MNRIISLIATILLAHNTFAAEFRTDRTWYLAGEQMTVSITDQDALIAYAELCDTQGLAAGTTISIHNHKGTGTIELPANLHSGYYALSVYTRHSAQVSNQLVAIINPLHKSKDDDIEWLSSDSSWVEANGTAKMINKKGTDTRETEGHIIRARINNTYNGRTFNGEQIRPSLSIVGKQIHYFEGKMENDSTAVFYTYGIHGKQPLVLSAASLTGMSLPIEIISPFATLLPKELPHLVFHYKRSEVEERSLAMQRHQIAIAPAKRELQLGDYSDETAEDGVPMDYDPTVFGNQPDMTYNLDEYRQFLTIKEVLIEYVQCVRSKKSNGVTQLFVRKEDDRYNNYWPASVLIDGMPVIDIDRLLKYDARRIHYINIYGDMYTFGNGINNGILSFITRSGRLTNYPTEPNTQYLVYEFPQ